jgi:transcription antitermination factor NusG
MSESEINWFALTVRPQHEKSVAERLVAKSLAGYTPLYRARRRWSDRTQTVDLPLFPRYVFCRFGFNDRLKVLGTLGVNSVVGFGGKPAPISDAEIDALQKVVGSGLPCLPWSHLRLGQRVRILGGALAGMGGILAREKGASRVVVNVDLLQRAVAVEIDSDLIGDY